MLLVAPGENGLCDHIPNKNSLPMMTSSKQYRNLARQVGCVLAAGCVMIHAGARGQTATPGVTASTERKWVAAWATSYLSTTVNGALQATPSFHNQTLRLNMFVKLGGTALRVKLSNRFSTQ